MVVIDQLIDRTWRRPLTFFGAGVVAHVGFGDPFCPGLRAAWIAGAKAAGLAVRETGTYLNMEGPQFSTRAESLLHKEMGCHVVGMTNATEARLAREAEMCYATLAFVTDYDAWRPHEAGVEATGDLRADPRDGGRGGDGARHGDREGPDGGLRLPPRAARGPADAAVEHPRRDPRPARGDPRAVPVGTRSGARPPASIPPPRPPPPPP